MHNKQPLHFSLSIVIFAMSVCARFTRFARFARFAR